VVVGAYIPPAVVGVQVLQGAAVVATAIGATVAAMGAGTVATGAVTGSVV
jgi:hypothetical protein